MKNFKNISIIAVIATEIIHFSLAIAFVGIMVILTKYSFSWKTVICIYFVIDWINGLQNSYGFYKLGFLCILTKIRIGNFAQKYR